MTERSAQLDPLPKRLIVFGVLVAIAVASIWLLDRRAMKRQQEMRRQYREQTPATQSVSQTPAFEISGHRFGRPTAL